MNRIENNGNEKAKELLSEHLVREQKAYFKAISLSFTLWSRLKKNCTFWFWAEFIMQI